MTTALIREVMSGFISRGLDPTEATWFDVSSIDPMHPIGTGTGMVDLLKECKPPFDKCIVLFRGRTQSHESYDVKMLVVGSDLEDGISIRMAKAPTGQPLRELPMIAYTVRNGIVNYGPMEESNQVSEQEGQMMLGFLAMWYRLMLSNCNAYQTIVNDTPVNRRRIAKGKKPLYDWRTVIISPKNPQSVSLGGTHASPRLHDRRGHLRKLASGKTVWIKQCKVGKASLGTVFHDYEVRQ